MVKRKLTVGGLISHLASVAHYHYKIKKKKNLVKESFSFVFFLSHMQSLCGI